MKSLLPEALKVLVVDDDAQMLRTITDILRLRGYSTLIAATGREALNITRDMNEAPAVALVDLQLPDMDGIDVIRGLRGWTAVPILILSARDMEIRATRTEAD